MWSAAVSSLRVEALGVSITISDSSIAIEQTKTEITAAGTTTKKAKPVPESLGSSAVITGRPPPLPKDVDDSTVRGDSATPVIDDEQTPDRPSPPGRHSPGGLPGDFDKGQGAQSGQTNSVWSDEEVEKLKALYPTHSASAIARQLEHFSIRLGVA
jgi:hypothetical protein